MKLEASLNNFVQTQYDNAKTATDQALAKHGGDHGKVGLDTDRGKVNINRLYISKNNELKQSSNILTHAYRKLTSSATGREALKASLEARGGPELAAKMLTRFNKHLANASAEAKAYKQHWNADSEKADWHTKESIAFEALARTNFDLEARLEGKAIGQEIIHESKSIAELEDKLSFAKAELKKFQAFKKADKDSFGNARDSSQDGNWDRKDINNLRPAQAEDGFEEEIKTDLPNEQDATIAKMKGAIAEVESSLAHLKGATKAQVGPEAGKQVHNANHQAEKLQDLFTM